VALNLILVILSVLDLAILLSYRTDGILVGSHLFFLLEKEKEWEESIMEPQKRKRGEGMEGRRSRGCEQIYSRRKDMDPTGILARWLAVRQARVRISARHPMEVPPTDPTAVRIWWWASANVYEWMNEWCMNVSTV
jgi:hypothetical protein